MRLDFTPEQEALRKELQAYFIEFMTPELKEELSVEFGGEGGGPEWRKAMRKLGGDGWIGIGWPKEYGGHGKSAIEQYIFTEEIMRAGFPYPFLTTESVGPTLAEFANDDMKEEMIPKILGGEINIAIGYSEPGAGTDLAALKTRAVKDGNEYVINGQKIFTSLAEFADYIWLAARTDDSPDIKKHKGISMFLIPFNTPGIEFTPIWTLGSVRTNATYYQDVRVPASCLVGGENKGWKMITSQLNRERLALVTHGPTYTLFNNVCQWARETNLPNGQRIIDQPWVQMNLAKIQTGLEAIKLVCYKQAWAIANGNLDMADASAAKVYGSEFFVEAFRMMGEILGNTSTLTPQSHATVLRGKVERMYRTVSILTFGGGTNEIQRDIISAAGLWIPRADR